MTRPKFYNAEFALPRKLSGLPRHKALGAGGVADPRLYLRKRVQLKPSNSVYKTGPLTPSLSPGERVAKGRVRGGRQLQLWRLRVD